MEDELMYCSEDKDEDMYPERGSVSGSEVDPTDHMFNDEDKDEDMYPETGSVSGSEVDPTDHMFNDDEEGKFVHRTYKVLQDIDVRKLIDEDIEYVSSRLFISKIEASKLLYHYRWNKSLLEDEWFSDTERVRSKVGLLENTIRFYCTGQLTNCGICFESFPLNDTEFYPTVCGHPYCVNCWKEYLSVSINDGPACLSMRCPEPNCRVAVVDESMVDKLALDDEKLKYNRYFIRSYIEKNKKIKWCPAPGCDNAVKFELGENIFDVTCLCSYSFCWNCIEEVHRPVDCATVGNWVLKNASDSETTAWIIAMTKPCPKCKRSIEKNHGCMHMTCNASCGHEFCWLCLGDWKNHGSGSFFSCNKYNTAKSQGLYNKEEEERELAKDRLDKYIHYYERWDGNHKSRQKAIEDLDNFKINQLDKLSDKLKITLTQLDFVGHAWTQIIECRRVLKWSYAYGYYSSQTDKAKKSLFEYLQGEAEAGLERLHHCAEKELSDFIEIAMEKDDKHTKKGDEETDEEKHERLEAEFEAFRAKLINLTKVTRSFFENLGKALENNFSEVKRSC